MIHKTDPQEIAPYLKDASNWPYGCASDVIIPETREELIEFLKQNTQPLTIAGAGTGLTAASVPQAGIVISLERFNHLGTPAGGAVEVGPAVSLKDLNAALQGSGWFYPPNPTESLASLGGTLATNASGSRSYKYGATREYVSEAEILLADGRSVVLKRGQTISSPLELDDGSRIVFPAVNYRSPRCKNAAGYYVQPGMDWLDLFIGSEGTLGIFTLIKLRLLPAPADFLSGILFTETEEACWQLVKSIRSDSSLDPCSLEYFDRYSLQKLAPRFSNIPAQAHAALFFEQAIASAEDFDLCLETWYAFLEPREILLDASWFAQSPKDLALFHEFRHQVPLIINEENSRSGRLKVGTDMAVPDSHFLDMMYFYRNELERSGLAYVMFGHIGDNHLHINLLPEKDQVESARRVYLRMVDQILKWGGTVSAEHGIGKLKKEYYQRMVGNDALADLRKIKQTLDPAGLLGVGNLL